MGFPYTVQSPSGEQFNTYTDKRHSLGTKLELQDGRIFRFAQMGATIGVANNLYESEVPLGDWDTMAVQAAAAVGAKTISYTNGGTTLVAANDLDDGYIIVESAAALGHMYKIKSHTTGAISVTITVTLEDGETVRSALTTSHKVTVVKNPYKLIIIHTASATCTAICVGVPQVLIAASSYGWVQVHGIGSCLLKGAALIGDLCIPSATAGSLDVAAGQTTNITQYIGRVVEVAPTTDFQLFNFCIE